MKIDDTLREGAIVLAHAAADAILAIYEHAFEVERKADASPLTAADLAAHRILVEGLERLTPDIPVLSEEAAEDTPWNVRRDWRRLWLVDPLDGTREFVKRNGEFTVNLALIEDGEVIFGVVQAPVTGQLWHGTRGGPALRRDADGEVVIQSRRPATAPLRVAASRSHRDTRTEDFIARMGEVEPIGLGSSLKFCRLAEGGMDVYPRFGPTNEWDTAAGQAVLEAAGGCVLDSKGRPMRYNQRDTLLNGDFMALGDPALPWRDWMGGA
ncbi:3'(2'),5'-bisphosphate nucleotidase CysQ [Lysobacter helvus]|uniref:3'(2'),5'-bisphosphate nucleotidase CysQ n=2 Tax=Lysobacteraceae TaxID=32033 RepID=A0ABM7Q648_9GAMM|nr:MULTISPECIES: 3'(2'),5'-bisphosphate nucleotidase CysQ [Lysobacter]BCT92733.1 3'(2'),5'-bisphosphate nucleotidase CysQ [Lysobacter caseinilyticus]BCT95886.1 3'(2'),5'-bisphosphate nucleotidase CysQ [Lysobacter helvus]